MMHKRDESIGLRDMRTAIEAIGTLQPVRDGLYAKQQLLEVAEYVGQKLWDWDYTLDDASLELFEEAKRSGFTGNTLEDDIDSAVVGGLAIRDNQRHNEACQFIRSRKGGYEYFNELIDTARHIPKGVFDQHLDELEGLAHLSGARVELWELSVEYMRAELIKATEHACIDGNKAVERIDKGLREGVQTMDSYNEYHNSGLNLKDWNETRV